MTYSPPVEAPLPHTVHTYSVWGGGGFGEIDAGSGTAGSGAWPSANRALYIPFIVQRTITAYKMFVMNGGTVSGNIDLGLYSNTGTRLVSTGSTAQSGTNNIQLVDITDTELIRGWYYLALACSSATATTLRKSFGSVGLADLAGLKQEAAALPLPATATFAVPASDYVPYIGFQARTGDL